jgi:Right handed beta helix region
MSRFSPAVVALALIAAVAATPSEAAQRAFVASTGSDANTASGCGLAAPCRTFAAALTVVDDGGEVIALDAAGYGPVTITKSVTITANPGFYAGIAGFPGGNWTAVTIATAGINVTLRGLAINGVGADNGIWMTDGARLSIENCVISNFRSGSGVNVFTTAVVRIVDSLIRDNGGGVALGGGATATISGTTFLGNVNGGADVYACPSGTTTTATISDSVFTNSYRAVYAYAACATATVQVSVAGSTLSNSSYGAVADSSVGTAVLTISNSMVTGNTIGLTAGAGTLESLGNNTVRQNGTNTVGTITTVSPM